MIVSRDLYPPRSRGTAGVQTSLMRVDGASAESNYQMGNSDYEAAIIAWIGRCDIASTRTPEGRTKQSKAGGKMPPTKSTTTARLTTAIARYANVSLQGLSLSSLTGSIPLGIVAGLWGNNWAF